jgi:SAM-dependent methyltransferase
MDGADAQRWSDYAVQWAELFGRFSDPARLAVAAATQVGRGVRVLDAGCGSGELLQLLDSLDADVAGLDPAPRMVDLARSRAPFADVRLGALDRLPWADRSFDVVMAFNALQFADDAHAALEEMARVVVPGGFVAISNWAEDERNDLNSLELAGAKAIGQELLPDGELRREGGLETLLCGAGLAVVCAGLVETPWQAPDDETLLRGVLLGDDAESKAAKSPAVLSAASRFRQTGGGYRLVNFFRYAVARTPSQMII